MENWELRLVIDDLTIWRVTDNETAETDIEKITVYRLGKNNADSVTAETDMTVTLLWGRLVTDYNRNTVDRLDSVTVESHMTVT